MMNIKSSAIFSIILIITGNGLSTQMPSCEAAIHYQQDFAFPKYPNLTAEDSLGHSISLSHLKGKTLYIKFWSTTCSPCIAHIPEENLLMDQISREDADAGIQFVTVCCMSSRQDWLKYIRTQRPGAVHLFVPGPGYKVFRRYKIPAFPKYHIVSNDFALISDNAPGPETTEIRNLLLKK